MGKEIDHGSARCCRRADAEEERDRAERTDRGIGEDAFQVFLRQGHERADSHRDPAGNDDRIVPQMRSAEDGTEARDQIDACLDHRCRVEVGAHRRGCLHGRGQPEVKRELR